MLIGRKSLPFFRFYPRFSSRSRALFSALILQDSIAFCAVFCLIHGVKSPPDSAANVFSKFLTSSTLSPPRHRHVDVIIARRYLAINPDNAVEILVRHEMV